MSIVTTTQEGIQRRVIVLLINYRCENINFFSTYDATLVPLDRALIALAENHYRQ